MDKRRASLVALLVLAVAATTLTGCGRRGLVRVNGERVQKDEFYQRLEKVPVQTAAGTMPAGMYVIEQMIRERLIQQLAAEKGVAPTEAQINKKIDLIKKQNGGDINRMLAMRGMTLEDLKRQLTRDQSLVNVLTKGVQVSDAEVQSTYNKALNAPNSALKRPEQVYVSAVVTNTKDKIDKAYKLLEDGQEFTSVVTRMSDDPNAKQNMGKLDWVAKEDTRVPPVIRKVAFSLSIGSYSKPTQIEKKWAVFRADQKRPAKVTTLNELKDVIKEQLAVQKASKEKFNKELQAFVKKSDIVVNAERYKTIPEMIKKQTAPTPQVPAGQVPAAAPVAQPNRR